LELRRSLPATYVPRYVDIPLRRLGSFYKSIGDQRRARDYYEQAWQEIEARCRRARRAWKRPSLRNIAILFWLR